MSHLRFPVVLVLSLMVGAVGCAAPSEPAAERRTAATSAPTVSTSSSTIDALDELSEEEARESGFSTGNYDAQLLGPATAGKKPVELTLKNVGKRSDNYQIKIVRPMRVG
jgi:hypothetical protein